MNCSLLDQSSVFDPSILLFILRHLFCSRHYNYSELEGRRPWDVEWDKMIKYCVWRPSFSWLRMCVGLMLCNLNSALKTVRSSGGRRPRTPWRDYTSCLTSGDGCLGPVLPPGLGLGRASENRWFSISHWFHFTLKLYKQLQPRLLTGVQPRPVFGRYICINEVIIQLSLSLWRGHAPLLLNKEDKAAH